MSSVAVRLAWVSALAALASVSSVARADGLRVGLSTAASQYRDPSGAPVSVFYSAVSTRVARGRAGMSFAVPYVGVSGGRLTGADDHPVVEGGAAATHWGMGDMSIGLDYNVIQNRQKMIILTVGGNMRFPTADSGKGLGGGENIGAFGLSGVYGITRQLIAFAELRQTWVGILTPVASRTRLGELGAVYWLTEKLGLNASLTAIDYGAGEPRSGNLGSAGGAALELNAGVSFELLPGMMVNAGGLKGLAGANSATGGGNLGFGFEL